VRAINRNRGLVLLACLAIISVLSLQGFSTSKAKKKKKQHAQKAAVLWRDPGNIRARDLYYGPGSKHLAPVPPFRFLKEVKDGSNPKFEVEDARGAKWRVKLGPEAQSETVSSRLLWAVGYNAEESYYFDRVNVRRTDEIISWSAVRVRPVSAGRTLRTAPQRCRARQAVGLVKKPFQGHARIERPEDDDGALE
jgi:hypothetical protein